MTSVLKLIKLQKKALIRVFVNFLCSPAVSRWGRVQIPTGKDEGKVYQLVALYY